MGGYLKIEEMVFQRDDKEQLLPVDMILFPLEKKTFITDKDTNGNDIKKVKIVKAAPVIKVIPAPRGKWLSILKMDPEEQDKEILFNHVVEPKITEKEYAAMKPMFVAAIVKAFTLLTLDLTPEEAGIKTKEEMTEAEEFELQKNLKEEKEEPSFSSTN